MKKTDESEINLERHMLAIGRLLHERLMGLSGDARERGAVNLARDIELVKLELANRIQLAVLEAQMTRARREREIG